MAGSADVNPEHGLAGNWRSAMIAVESTIAQVILCLEQSGVQIALVVDDERRLIGTLTDGDIRRGLLRGLDINSPIESIIFRSPMVVPPPIDRDLVLQLMSANKLHQLPVVNDDREVVGLHLWDDLMQPVDRANTMVIMAGGKGIRLRPHTENCPKPLLPVGGKPMLQHIIERAKGEGFYDFIIAVHYLGHMIEEHFGDGARLGVRIQYLREKQPLGTAGALSLLEHRTDTPILVTNGDVMSDIRYGDLLDFHNRHGATATMAVRLHEWEYPFGVVRTRGVDIVGFEEKPISRSHINAGVYVLGQAALDALAPGEACDMPELFLRLQQFAGRTIAYPMHEPWLDVGRASDLERARSENSE